MDATQYCYGDLCYFRGGGYSSHLTHAAAACP